MNKIIKYINETEISAMVKFITTESSKDIWTVMTQIKEGEAEFIRKSQQLIEELSKHLTVYEVGMIVETQEDCLNNFRKGQRLDITAVSEEGISLDNVATIEEKWIRKHFKVVGMRDCL